MDSSQEQTQGVFPAGQQYQVHVVGHQAPCPQPHIRFVKVLAHKALA
jgi:hypothetical protein